MFRNTGGTAETRNAIFFIGPRSADPGLWSLQSGYSETPWDVGGSCSQENDQGQEKGIGEAFELSTQEKATENKSLTDDSHIRFAPELTCPVSALASLKDPISLKLDKTPKMEIVEGDGDNDDALELVYGPGLRFLQLGSDQNKGQGEGRQC